MKNTGRKIIKEGRPGHRGQAQGVLNFGPKTQPNEKVPVFHVYAEEKTEAQKAKIAKKQTIAQRLNRPILVTVDQLIDFIKGGIKSSTFATIITGTECQIMAGCPYDNIYKVSKHQVDLNFRYRNSVQNRMDKEGINKTFIPQSRVWGSHVKNSWCLIEHDDKIYLETLPIKGRNFGYKYLTIDSQGLLRIVPRVIAQKWIYPDKAPSTQPQKDKVRVRDYNIMNIFSISIMGHKLRIID